MIQLITEILQGRLAVERQAQVIGLKTLPFGQVLVQLKSLNLVHEQVFWSQTVPTLQVCFLVHLGGIFTSGTNFLWQAQSSWFHSSLALQSLTFLQTWVLSFGLIVSLHPQVVAFQKIPFLHFTIFWHSSNEIYGLTEDSSVVTGWQPHVARDHSKPASQE